MAVIVSFATFSTNLYFNVSNRVTQTPSVQQPSATSRVALPAGWHIWQDPTGFSVAVPEGWRVTQNGTHMYFNEAPGAKYLLVDQTDQPQPDALVDLQNKEQYRVPLGDFPDYQRVRLESINYYYTDEEHRTVTFNAAEWEYTYRLNGVPTHVLFRDFITAPDKAYAILWSTPASEWAGSLASLQVVLDSFEPAKYALSSNVALAGVRQDADEGGYPVGQPPGSLPTSPPHPGSA
jgi:hypothetical protein